MLEIKRNGSIVVIERDVETGVIETSDPRAILDHMRTSVQFEEGLTVRQLMKALKPWKDVLGRLAWMDFDAWFTAIDKTYIAPVTSDTDSDGEPDVVCLELYSVVNIHRSDEGELSLDFYWDFHGRYSTPFIDHDMKHETCSLSFSNPVTYANLPIKIVDDACVIDHSVGPPEGRRPVLADKMPGVYSSVTVPRSFFDLIVLGFLDNISFHGSPDEMGEVREAVYESVRELKETLEKPASDAVAEKNADEDVAEVEETPLVSIYQELGIEIDEQRYSAVFSLYRVMEKVSVEDESLAEILGLTSLGLEELKNGVTAQYSTKTLIRWCDLIESHIQRRDALRGDMLE